MFLGELLFALCMAALFTFIFTLGLKRPGPWAAGWTFFVVLFLAAWAGGLWISPAGPAFSGIYWLPIMLIAFMVALLLAASSPPRTPPANVDTMSEVHEKESTAEKAFDIFFWVLMVSLILLIVIGYLAPRGTVID